MEEEPAASEPGVAFYERTYGHFQLGARERVRRATYDEDLGQNSWLTATEWRTFADWLELTTDRSLLDVGCGSGGPALAVARARSVRVTGIDRQPAAVAAATAAARQQGLGDRARFVAADASQPLPFRDATFDAIVCIDAINHLAGRAQVFAEWYRLLRPRGRILFTDPVVVTGLVSNEDLAARSAIGYFLFAPPGENERLLRGAGFTLVRREDTTPAVATVATRWARARAQDRAELIADEGAQTFEGTQRFLEVVATLADERRLSRFAFVARK